MNKKIKSILKYCYFLPGALYGRIALGLSGATVGKHFEEVGRIYVKNKGTLHIGNYVRVRSGMTTNPIGMGTRTYLHVFHGGTLKIGNHVKMSNTAISCQKSVEIEDFVMIGGGVCIYDTDFHSLNSSIRMELIDAPEIPKSKNILIKERAFIGAGACILKGVTIGKNSIIGARSVVTSDVPDNQVWAGNPAVFIRDLKKEELEGEEIEPQN